MASMNALIPLSGQQLDIAGSYARGADVYQQMQDRERQNALREFLQAQGGAIMEGDQNALAQLAGYDPQMAMGLQGDRQQMDLRQKSFDLDRRNTESMISDRQARLGMIREKAAQEAAALDATQKREAVATMSQALPVFANARSPEEWDGLADKLGSPELKGQFDQREEWLALGEGILAGAQESMVLDQGDVVFDPNTNTPIYQAPRLEDDKPANIQALEYRAREAGLEPGSPEYREFMAQGGKTGGMSIQASPDGGITFQQGPGVKFTEAQSKDNVFATRAAGALPDLEQYGGALTNWWQQRTDDAPMGLGRFAQTPEYQMGQNAGLEFLQAILRKDTGAAITPAEQEEYGKVYLPQPGDTPEVLGRKQEARARAVAAIESGMSAQQLLSRDRALLRSSEGSGGAQQIQSVDDYNQLAPGTQYIDPNGNLRTKR